MTPSCYSVLAPGDVITFQAMRCVMEGDIMPDTLSNLNQVTVVPKVTPVPPKP